MTTPSLTLGSVKFQGFELPERIAGLGGDQMLVIHQFVGGRRKIDAMGGSDAPIEWGGRFRGNGALSRADAVDKMRVAGAQIALTFGAVSRQVVIRRFVYDVERTYEVPYSITVEVVSEDPGGSAAPGLDEMVLGDNATAQALGARIGDGPLSGVLSSLDGAISKVSSFATAAQATVNSVLQPIAQVQGRISTLIASAENTMGQVTTLGGILPNNPVSTMVARLGAQVSAVTHVADLYDLQSTVGRMGANLNAVGAGGAQVVMAGGDLFRLAEQSYGDAGEWATIAKANGLTDPIIQGLQTILVPPTARGADGLLGA